MRFLFLNVQPNRKPPLPRAEERLGEGDGHGGSAFHIPGWRYAMAVGVAVLLSGCATAELAQEGKAKVSEGQLIRLETENQETLVDYVVEALLSKASGVMHDLKIKVKSVDGEKVQRKLGEGNQVFALAPGAHDLVVECTHEITKGKTLNSQSRVDTLKVQLRQGYWYQIKSREDGDSCEFIVSENKL